MAPLTPLQARKQLLVATSALQRAQLGRTLGHLVAVSRESAQAAGRQAKTVAKIAAGVGLFHTLTSPFRRRSANGSTSKPRERVDGGERGGSRVSQAISWAQSVVSLWLTLRPLIRPSDAKKPGPGR